MNACSVNQLVCSRVECLVVKEGVRRCKYLSLQFSLVVPVSPLIENLSWTSRQGWDWCFVFLWGGGGVSSTTSLPLLLHLHSTCSLALCLTYISDYFWLFLNAHSISFNCTFLLYLEKYTFDEMAWRPQTNNVLIKVKRVIQRIGI